MEKKFKIFNKVIDMIIVGILTYTAGVVIESQLLSYVCISAGLLCVLKLINDLVE